ncbi:MAG: HEAT repeat domain-containing protein [Caldimonas sp.]
MPVTMKQVLAEIDREEPNYPAFEKLGAGALPHLQMIAEAGDPLKAAKAVYAASLIGGSAALDLLSKAADHHDPQVRMAVTQGLQNLAQTAPSELVMKSLNDDDAGVRKLAVRTAETLNRVEFAPRVAEIAKSDPAEHLRAPAAAAAERLAPSVPAKKTRK